jgi:hypothetical protein
LIGARCHAEASRLGDSLAGELLDQGREEAVLHGVSLVCRAGN